MDEFNPDLVKVNMQKQKRWQSQLCFRESKKRIRCSCHSHPAGIIGPYDYGRGHLTQLVLDYFNKKLTALVNGGYDFVDVRDVAEGIIQAIEKGKRGECYILSNKYISIRDLVKMIAPFSTRKPIKTILPIWFAKLTAPLAELYYKIRKPPLYTSILVYLVIKF